ncbi:hypothetical protein AAMO2058_001696900 [Amorphochlora amoebiformis]
MTLLTFSEKIRNTINSVQYNFGILRKIWGVDVIQGAVPARAPTGKKCRFSGYETCECIASVEKKHEPRVDQRCKHPSSLLNKATARQLSPQQPVDSTQRTRPLPACCQKDSAHYMYITSIQPIITNLSACNNSTYKPPFTGQNTTWMRFSFEFN